MRINKKKKKKKREGNKSLKLLCMISKMGHENKLFSCFFYIGQRVFDKFLELTGFSLVPFLKLYQPVPMLRL